ncbi:MAG: hypothetical protein N2596_02045 [Syntrophorhabdaceae bacterium]|nr:hypothetical protein [Syntrophorhabdaceae bacterium]
MKKLVIILFFLSFVIAFSLPCHAQKYITLGILTSLKLIEGYEGHRAATLAVEEINAKGGVKVGADKYYSRSQY